MAITDPMMTPEMVGQVPTVDFEGYFEEEKDPLSKFYESNNIAEDLDKERLKKIGKRCHEGYDADEASRKDWLDNNKEGIKLANQVKETKTFPWRGAANVKLPVIADAAIKFAARAYSEIIKDDKVVKGRVVGEDPMEEKQQRADRVGDFMSYQLMEKEVEWEPDTDKLLHVLPVVGHLFRKRYWCAPEKRTKSELCLPDKICVNNKASSLEAARRITHIIDNVSHNTVISNQRGGIWLDVELQEKKATDSKDTLGEEDYYCFLEQCCWLDMDEDGYEEPYIVTFEKDSQKVVRIVADYDEQCIYRNDKKEVMSIKRKMLYTDYIFMPSLDGSYYGTGFGQLLSPLNSVANSIMNQLIDAGTLSNTQGGYLSKEIKIRGGRHEFAPFEYKTTGATSEQLSKGVFPFPVREPSPTLFNLLGLILELTQDLASVKDVLAGDAPGLNVPATTVLALIEQGMKTFNAIYKRIYRSLKKEFKQLYDINHEYLDEQEYYNVLDDQKAVMKADFERTSTDVIPVADPTMSSDMQRLAKAEALKSTIGIPGVEIRPIMKNYYDALRVPQEMIDEILPEKDPNAVPPEVQAMMQELEFKEADIKVKEQEQMLKDRELDLKERELESKIVETITKAIKNLADAEAAEAGPQLGMYQAITRALSEERKIDEQIEQRRLASMEKPPGNAGGNQSPVGAAGANAGAVTQP